MIRDTIQRMIASAAAALHERGELEIPADGLPAFELDRPAQAQHGDYASNLAMKLARPPKSREIATQIADYLNEIVGVVPAYEMVERIEVAGPGFINIRLRPEWLLKQAPAMIAAGQNVGQLDIGTGTRINLEFVSANPTGPVHLGNGRGGFIGDTLGNVLRAAGYDVTKEYYFNDYGQQIEKLGSAIAWYMRLALGEKDAAKPEIGYFDNPDDPNDTFYQQIARRVLEEGNGADLLKLPSEAQNETIGHAAAQFIMAGIKHTMEKLHIEFDVWFYQASLDSSGALQAGIKALRERGYIFEQDGAQWMESSRFGDDKDRVVIKSDGQPTYVASDIAYALNKLERGYDRLIYVLGPDHHGYVPRLKAIALMFGYAPERVHVLIYQQVNLKIGGVSTKMSKREGTLVTLDDLEEMVGADVTRFFYLMRDSNTHLDFDLALAMKQNEDNPGLTVQYGHARVAGVLRKAAETGLKPEEEAQSASMAALLNDPAEQLNAELALIRELTRLEEIIERAALALEPHHLTKYGMDVATTFHIFYDRCPILRAEPDVRAARFALTLAARTVLARVLTLLGMSAPDRMERATE